MDHYAGCNIPPINVSFQRELYSIQLYSITFTFRVWLK